MTTTLTVIRDPLRLFARDRVLPANCVATWLRDDTIPDGTVFRNGRCYVAKDGYLWPSDETGRIAPKAQRIDARMVESWNGGRGYTRADTRWRVLEAMDDDPVPDTLAVAELLEMDESAIRYHLRTLTGDGYLAVTPNPEHRSYNVYRVTDAGRLAVQKWREELDGR